MNMDLFAVAFPEDLIPGELLIMANSFNGLSRIWRRTNRLILVGKL